MVKNGTDSEPVTKTALMDFYSKCGHVDESFMAFGDEADMLWWFVFEWDTEKLRLFPCWNLADLEEHKRTVAWQIRSPSGMVLWALAKQVAGGLCASDAEGRALEWASELVENDDLNPVAFEVDSSDTAEALVYQCSST
ncbi:hypothetical protein QQ045_020370 [Rhodiola kirilowii]